MTALTLAAAQSISIAGDVPANIQQHLLLMRAAAEHGVQLLVFPELSLTGYEPSLAGGLAIVPEDAVLMPLREMARELQLTAVVGMPIRLASQAGVLIGALVLGRTVPWGCTPSSTCTLAKRWHLFRGRVVQHSNGGRIGLRWRSAQTSPMAATRAQRQTRGLACMPPAC